MTQNQGSDALVEPGPDAQDEIERLVVVRGAASSTAADVPWQLDRRLRPATTSVEASAPAAGVLRLDVVDSGTTTSTWSGPGVVLAQLRPFGGPDVGLRLTFSDGSRLRIDAKDNPGLKDLQARLVPA